MNHKGEDDLLKMLIAQRARVDGTWCVLTVGP